MTAAQQHLDGSTTPLEAFERGRKDDSLDVTTVVASDYHDLTSGAYDSEGSE